MEQNKAMIEMQRRLLVAIREFNKTSSRLTWAMLILTVAIGVIAGVQLWAMLKGPALDGVTPESTVEEVVDDTPSQ